MWGFFLLTLTLYGVLIGYTLYYWVTTTYAVRFSVLI
jgi:hypothetical protein